MKVPVVKSKRDGINLAAKPSGTGCAECVAQGAWWFHPADAPNAVTSAAV